MKFISELMMAFYLLGFSISMQAQSATLKLGKIDEVVKF